MSEAEPAVADNAGVEGFLAPYPAGVRALALETRAFVLAALPADTAERVYPGWHTIGYGRDGTMGGRVCYILIDWLTYGGSWLMLATAALLLFLGLAQVPGATRVWKDTHR